MSSRLRSRRLTTTCLLLLCLTVLSAIQRQNFNEETSKGSHKKARFTGDFKEAKLPKVLQDNIEFFKNEYRSVDRRSQWEKDEQNLLNIPREEKKEGKKVLLYSATTFFNDKLDGNYVLKRDCSKETQKYCSYTTDPNRSKEADAWLYHNIDFSSPSIMKNWTTDQVHVMYSLESPLYQKFKFEPNKINWTMSYRLDSDIPWPYGRMEKKEIKTIINMDLIWELKKEHLVAASFISNCQAGNFRLEVAKKAKEEGLELDIFGDCGDKQAPACDRRSGDLFNCAAQIVKEYYFYLAFENSNCVDYVTEKFFNSLHLSYAVPIVIKREIYTKMGIPSSSFIALDDFKSIKEMVEFLQELKKNKEKYLSYHEWRNSWDVKPGGDSAGLCGLCERLRKGPPYGEKSYSNLTQWFSEDKCDNRLAEKYLGINESH